MARDLILGTAGHIDHGKTSLVKALTGIDCDRLPEEKARGITIDIGFASLDLPPLSHRRRGRARPRALHQEHARRARPASISPCWSSPPTIRSCRRRASISKSSACSASVTASIALTKSDLVDETTREVVELEIRELVRGTFLEDAPIIATSAHTGAGLA